MQSSLSEMHRVIHKINNKIEIQPTFNTKKNPPAHQNWHKCKIDVLLWWSSQRCKCVDLRNKTLTTHILIELHALNIKIVTRCINMKKRKIACEPQTQATNSRCATYKQQIANVHVHPHVRRRKIIMRIWRSQRKCASTKSNAIIQCVFCMQT